MKFIAKVSKRGFSGGPYNPLRYKTNLAPRSIATPEEMEKTYAKTEHIPFSPIRNMRHINPVRQSGPLPPHDGPHTMEDIRKIYFNTTIGDGFDNCHTDPEEIMRRVPGITRKEAEHITTLGLNPDEEVDYAYIAFNLGLDVFYVTNSVYVARQVQTNSKGEKCEIYWNSQSFEDISTVNVGHAPTLGFADYHWEIFLWGELAIHPRVDFDLSVPLTWFEYEEETWAEQNMMEDQISLPEDVRKVSEKHPNCSKELWYSQEDLDRIEEMNDPDWAPSGTKYNIYNKDQFISNRLTSQETDQRIK